MLRAGKRKNGEWRAYHRRGNLVEDQYEGSPEADRAELAEALANEPVKRGRGRPKGLPKTGGRQKAKPNATPPAETLKTILERGEAFSDAFQRLLDIGLGKSITQVGPTGKQYRAPAAAALQVTALNTVLSKIIPEQRANTTTVDAKAEIRHVEEPSNRDLARAVLDILRTAKLDADVTPTELHKINRRLAADDIDYSPAGVPSKAPAVLGVAAVRQPGGGLAAASSDYGPDPNTGVESLDPMGDHAQGIRRLGGRPSDPRLWGVAKEAQPPNSFSAPKPRPGPQCGDRVKVEGCRGSLEVSVVMNDQRVRYFLLDEHGQRLAPITGKEQAENALREFEETGSVDMSKRRR